MAFIWSDPNLVASVTPIRALHLNELRSGLNYLCSAKGLSPRVYSDGPWVFPSATPIRYQHINDLREAIETLFLPSKVWSQQAGVTAVSGRLSNAIPIRVIHFQELRSALDQIKDMLNGLTLGSATISVIGGGAPSPTKHISVEVFFSPNQYSALKVPNPQFLFTPSNTTALPTLTMSPSISDGAGSFVFNFPTEHFGVSGSQGYYTVSVVNYPIVGSVITNTVTISSDMMITGMGLFTERLGFHRWYSAVLYPSDEVYLVVIYDADPTGIPITLVSHQGISSLYAEFQATGSISFIGENNWANSPHTLPPTDTGASYAFPYSQGILIHPTTLGIFDHIEDPKYPNSYSPPCEVVAAPEALVVTYVFSLDAAATGAGDNQVLSTGAIITSVRFSRPYTVGDPLDIAVTTPDGTVLHKNTSEGSWNGYNYNVSFGHSNFPSSFPATCQDTVVFNGVTTTGASYHVSYASAIDSPSFYTNSTPLSFEGHTWTAPATGDVDLVIIGGGGGGGTWYTPEANYCGGGGGGAAILARSVRVVAGQKYTINVGNRGNNNGVSGGASTFGVADNWFLQAGGGVSGGPNNSSFGQGGSALASGVVPAVSTNMVNGGNGGHTGLNLEPTSGACGGGGKKGGSGSSGTIGGGGGSGGINGVVGGTGGFFGGGGSTAGVAGTGIYHGTDANPTSGGEGTNFGTGLSLPGQAGGVDGFGGGTFVHTYRGGGGGGYGGGGGEAGGYNEASYYYGGGEGGAGVVAVLPKDWLINNGY